MTQHGNEVTQSVLNYGQSLTAAIRAFKILEAKAGWFERLQIKLLRAGYQRRLRALVAALPTEVSEEFFKEESTQ